MVRGFKAMETYLELRGEDLDHDWRKTRAITYLTQCFFPNYPEKEVGLRTSREMRTVALALDHVVKGNLGEAGDILMQRLKALETSVKDGSWVTAKHLEIIPRSVTSMTDEEEQRLI